ncbi:C6 finger domain-containing protein [Purpureocillium lavendulum]|uniref:C6 finger domain-containing protein n=1 Tax=Purpureocillium lavendulum TaxID=1247861 RepID=A0AB34G7H3_9HYPO|nr:C6 finger domain-containing protein [Purpureocillium lavendulum]
MGSLKDAASAGTGAAVTGRTYPSVELTPWDPTDDAQYKRMYEQRVACTWGFDEVEDWKEKMLNGQKVLYWISIAEDFPARDELVAQHVKQWPKESDGLVDSAAVINGTTREPTKKAFHPVGHIAIETFPDRNTQFGLPQTTFWVKSLYISWALQASGLGRSAMAAVERVIAGPPFGADCVALDTVPSEFQLREEQMAGFYDARGVPRPAVIRTNEEWYRRQGYEVVARNASMYDWVNPATGETTTVPCVFMRNSDGDSPNSDGDSPNSDGDSPNSDGDSPNSDGDSPKSDGSNASSSIAQGTKRCRDVDDNGSDSEQSSAAGSRRRQKKKPRMEAPAASSDDEEEQEDAGDDSEDDASMVDATQPLESDNEEEQEDAGDASDDDAEIYMPEATQDDESEHELEPTSDREGSSSSDEFYSAREHLTDEEDKEASPAPAENTPQDVAVASPSAEPRDTPMSNVSAEPRDAPTASATVAPQDIFLSGAPAAEEAAEPSLFVPDDDDLPDVRFVDTNDNGPLDLFGESGNNDLAPTTTGPQNNDVPLFDIPEFQSDDNPVFPGFQDDDDIYGATPPASPILAATGGGNVSDVESQGSGRPGQPTPGNGSDDDYVDEDASGEEVEEDFFENLDEQRARQKKRKSPAQNPTGQRQPQGTVSQPPPAAPIITWAPPAVPAAPLQPTTSGSSDLTLFQPAQGHDFVLNEAGELVPAQGEIQRGDPEGWSKPCRFCRNEGSLMHKDTPCDWYKVGTYKIECTNCANHRRNNNPLHGCITLRNPAAWRKYADIDPIGFSPMACDGCIAKGTAWSCDVDTTLGYACTNCKSGRRPLPPGAEPPATPEPGQPKKRERPRGGLTEKNCFVQGVYQEKPPNPRQGLRKWYRHACDPCRKLSGNGQKNGIPCSWLHDRTSWNQPCAQCVAKGTQCSAAALPIGVVVPPPMVIPSGWSATINFDSVWSDHRLNTPGRKECLNCRRDDAHCRTMTMHPDGACNKCMQFGFDCISDEGGRAVPGGPVYFHGLFDISRVGFGKQMPYYCCKRCVETGRNCDKQRPCDSCTYNGEAHLCDPYDNTHQVINGRIEPQPGCLYYLALGYGPLGVNDVKDGSRLCHWVGPPYPLYGLDPNSTTTNFEGLVWTGVNLRKKILPGGIPPYAGPNGVLDGIRPSEITPVHLDNWILAGWPEAYPLTEAPRLEELIQWAKDTSKLKGDARRRQQRKEFKDETNTGEPRRSSQLSVRGPLPRPETGSSRNTPQESGFPPLAPMPEEPAQAPAPADGPSPIPPSIIDSLAELMDAANQAPPAPRPVVIQGEDLVARDLTNLTEEEQNTHNFNVWYMPEVQRMGNLVRVSEPPAPQPVDPPAPVVVDASHELQAISDFLGYSQDTRSRASSEDSEWLPEAERRRRAELAAAAKAAAEKAAAEQAAGDQEIAAVGIAEEDVLATPDYFPGPNYTGDDGFGVLPIADEEAPAESNTEPPTDPALAMPSGFGPGGENLTAVPTTEEQSDQPASGDIIPPPPPTGLLPAPSTPPQTQSTSPSRGLAAPQGAMGGGSPGQRNDSEAQAQQPPVPVVDEPAADTLPEQFGDISWEDLMDAGQLSFDEDIFETTQRVVCAVTGTNPEDWQGNSYVPAGGQQQPAQTLPSDIDTAPTGGQAQASSAGGGGQEQQPPIPEPANPSGADFNIDDYLNLPPDGEY